MSNNNINTPATSQTPALAQDWALIPTYDTIEYGEMYETPTGHYVEVKTTHYPCRTHFRVKASSEDGYVIACDHSFGGFEQEQAFEAFYKSYMGSARLQHICEHFDELYTPYDDDEE